LGAKTQHNRCQGLSAALVFVLPLQPGKAVTDGVMGFLAGFVEDILVYRIDDGGFCLGGDSGAKGPNAIPDDSLTRDHSGPRRVGGTELRILAPEENHCPGIIISQVLGMYPRAPTILDIDARNLDLPAVLGSQNGSARGQAHQQAQGQC
jgi:hypothetical protein